MNFYGLLSAVKIFSKTAGMLKSDDTCCLRNLNPNSFLPLRFCQSAFSDAWDSG
jgi:hypothetical protein